MAGRRSEVARPRAPAVRGDGDRRLRCFQHGFGRRARARRAGEGGEADGIAREERGGLRGVKQPRHQRAQSSAMAVARPGAERSEERAEVEGASEGGSGELGWGSPHPHREQGARGMEVAALLVHGRHAGCARRFCSSNSNLQFYLKM